MTIAGRKNDKELKRQLAIVLTDIEKNDTDYDARYPLVFRAVTLALQLGYKAGIGTDPDEPDWPVIFIELPTGQVSWHMEKYPHPWDGHDTSLKYWRIYKYAFTEGRW